MRCMKIIHKTLTYCFWTRNFLVKMDLVETVADVSDGFAEYF